MVFSSFQINAHWGRDKLPAILQTTFWNSRFVRKLLHFELDFTKTCSSAPINKKSALVWIMVWCRMGDKPWSQQIFASFMLTCFVTRPRWLWCSPVLLRIFLVIYYIRKISSLYYHSELSEIRICITSFLFIFQIFEIKVGCNLNWMYF